ncbi:hypothetical protein [Streptomyces sp. I05A-00742]|uniref:hypothetical protein n=1 Tax=Streptomyces sp. I05A-00742 TaxID=2732853 RepID=UPI0014881EDE|nr:hypothetical protein [Streptomyces sp. I05A-00742]
MSSPDLGVQAHGPTSVAAEFQAASSDGRELAKLDDPGRASAAHDAWAVSAASTECIASWRNRLHELGRSARTAASAVTKSMDAYTGTDRSIAEGLRKAGGSLEGA